MAIAAKLLTSFCLLLPLLLLVQPHVAAGADDDGASSDEPQPQLRALLQAIARAPRSAMAHQRLSEHLLPVLWRQRAAAAATRAAAALGGRAVRGAAYNNLGTLLDAAGRGAEAAAAFRRAARADPGEAAAPLANLCRTELARSGDAGAAAAACRRAIALAPGNYEMRRFLGKALTEGVTRGRRLEEGAAAFEACVALARAARRDHVWCRKELETTRQQLRARSRDDAAGAEPSTKVLNICGAIEPASNPDEEAAPPPPYDFSGACDGDGGLPVCTAVEQALYSVALPVAGGALDGACACAAPFSNGTRALHEEWRRTRATLPLGAPCPSWAAPALASGDRDRWVRVFPLRWDAATSGDAIGRRARLPPAEAWPTSSRRFSGNSNNKTSRRTATTTSSRGYASRPRRATPRWASSSTQRRCRTPWSASGCGASRSGARGPPAAALLPAGKLQRRAGRRRSSSCRWSR